MDKELGLGFDDQTELSSEMQFAVPEQCMPHDGELDPRRSCPPPGVH